MATAPETFLGRMNDPTAAESVTGPCGDSMEFYIVARNGTIEDIRYYTDGCESTRSCGEAVARRVWQQTVEDALSISPREVMDSLPDLAEGERHCAILAVSALFRTIGSYWLMP